MQIDENGESLQLAFPVEAVAALCFERGGAMRGEFAQVRERAVVQRSRRGLAQAFHARQNAATGASDLFVGGAEDALFVFGSAAGGENQVRMRIDEAGQENASAQVEFFGATSSAKPLDSSARPDGGDAVATDEDGPIANDFQVAQGGAATGNGTAQGEQLRAARNQQVRHVGTQR